MKYQFYDIVPNKMEAAKVIKNKNLHYKVKVKRIGRTQYNIYIKPKGRTP